MQKSVLFMGLGYIGLPTAALVADAGLQVTGVDINENVVNNINNCDISNQLCHFLSGTDGRGRFENI